MVWRELFAAHLCIVAAGRKGRARGGAGYAERLHEVIFERLAAGGEGGAHYLFIEGRVLYAHVALGDIYAHDGAIYIGAQRLVFSKDLHHRLQHRDVHQKVQW